MDSSYRGEFLGGSSTGFVSNNFLLTGHKKVLREKIRNTLVITERKPNSLAGFDKNPGPCLIKTIAFRPNGVPTANPFLSTISINRPRNTN